MKEVLNKNIILGIIIGGIIFESLNVAASTFLYSSDQISYGDKDVKAAIDELYDYANKQSSTPNVYYLGTGTSFDIKTKYPDIDYTKLTANNFITGVTAINRVNATYGPSGGEYRYISAYITGFNLSKSYNSTTGVLTVGGNGYSLTGCIDNGFIYCKDAYSAANATPFVYLVVGNIQS